MFNKAAFKKILADGSVNEMTEDLNSYLNSSNRNRRINIPKISAAQIEMEEVVTQLIQSFISSPCLIQIDYSEDSFLLSNMKTFVSILVEQEGLWKVILKDQSWVSVSLSAEKTNISFSTAATSANQVESVLKTISARTTDIVSYNVIQDDAQIEISLKIDGPALTKLNSEGSIL